MTSAVEHFFCTFFLSSRRVPPPASKKGSPVVASAKLFTRETTTGELSTDNRPAPAAGTFFLCQQGYLQGKPRLASSQPWQPANPRRWYFFSVPERSFTRETTTGELSTLATGQPPQVTLFFCASKAIFANHTAGSTF